MEEEHSLRVDSDNLDQCIQELLLGKKPLKATIAKICEKAKEILASEPNVVSLRAPMTICGNVSGQFGDLLEIFRLVGKPPETNFVFMGNYFHRGLHGVETFSLLLALKVRFPDKVTLLRGMGEEISTSQLYGFESECERNFLPLCAVVEESYFCLAGGLTRYVSTIDHIQQLYRFENTEDHENKVKQMVWSEPGDAEDWVESFRGCGYLFPKKASKMFNHMNNLRMICRINRLEMEGYAYTHDKNVLSICSSPNYLNTMNNLGAIVKIDEFSEMQIKQFSAAEILEIDKTRSLDYFSRKQANILKEQEEALFS